MPEATYPTPFPLLTERADMGAGSGRGFWRCTDVSLHRARPQSHLCFAQSMVAAAEVAWRTRIRSKEAIQEAKDSKSLTRSDYRGKKIRERN